MTTWHDFVSACESCGIDPIAREAQLVKTRMSAQQRHVWEDDGTDYPDLARQALYGWMIEQVTT